MTPINHARAYTVVELATRWQISRHTVTRMILDGILKAFRVGDPKSNKPRWRISPAEVERYEAGPSEERSVKRNPKPRVLPSVTKWV